MTVQFQLRSHEILGAQAARNAVATYMTDASSSVIVDGRNPGYQNVLEVIADITDEDTFSVELTDSGVQLSLVGSDFTILTLNGLCSEMDNYGRWFAIPAEDAQ